MSQNAVGGEATPKRQNTILVGDDDADMSEALCDVLRSEGYAVQPVGRRNTIRGSSGTLFH